MSIPLAASIRNCTAAPTAAPPGTMRVIALPASWDVTTGNHSLVRRASRCRANVQQKWAISAPIASANQRGSRVDSRGQDANTSVIAGKHEVDGQAGDADDRGALGHVFPGQRARLLVVDLARERPLARGRGPVSHGSLRDLLIPRRARPKNPTCPSCPGQR